MLFFSNVFSLMDWSDDGVNNCTLMYLRNIEMARFSANKLQGPEITLVLRFNQFSSHDYGYGVGWDFNFTRIESETDQGAQSRTLVLSDGSRYRIDSETAEAVTLKYKKINMFKFEKNESGYTVTYKNGIVETLTSGRLSRIQYPNGKGVGVASYTDGSFTITDDDGVVMVATVAKNATHRVTTPRATFVLNFAGNDLSELASIAVDGSASGEKLYQFSYAYHNNEQCLEMTSCESWLDFYQKESISYVDLPAPAGLAATVRAVSTVDSYVSTDTDGTIKSVHKTYGYQKESGSGKERNYLGYPDVVAWNNKADNLELLPDEYQFVSYEKVGTTKTPSRTTESKYNKYYLMTSLKPFYSLQERTIFEIYYYDLVAGSNIDGQTSTFMLPVKKEYKQSSPGSGGKIIEHSDVEIYEYDADANLTRHTNIEGMTVWSEYYDATGEKDSAGNLLCPASPSGMVDYLKKKTLSPGVGKDNYPKKVWDYTYVQLDKTQLILIATEHFHVEKLSQSTPAPVLQKTAYSYEPDGRPGAMVVSVGTIGNDGGVSYLSTTKSASYVEDDSNKQLTMTETLAGYDGASSQCLTRQRYVTADIVQTQDKNKLVFSYEYDILGRVIKTDYAVGGRFPVTETIVFNAAKNTVTRQKTSDKRTSISLYDGLGRLVKESISVDGENTLWVMAEQKYNDLGQLVSESKYDYAANGNIISKQVNTFVWNVFDEMISQSNWDKSSQKYGYDFHENALYKKSIAVTKYPGDISEIMFYDNHNRLRLKEQRSPSSKTLPDIKEIFDYDALGRLIRHTETDRETLVYSYDYFDRQIEKKGTSSGTVKMAYAPHSTDELVTSTQIDATLMSLYSYDGLGRVKESKISGVATRYDYAGSAIFMRPSQVTVAADTDPAGNQGRVWKYEYVAEMNEISQCQICDLESGEVYLSRKYNYDATTGLLTSSSAGEYSRTFSHDDYGHLLEETGQWAGLVMGSYKTVFVRTKSGNIESLMVMMKFGGEKGHVVKKNYQYFPDGNVKSIVIKLNNAIVSQCNLVWDKTSGNLVKQHLWGSLIWDGKFAALSIHKRYGENNLVNKLSYFDKNGRFLTSEIKYDAHCNIKDVQYDFAGSQHLTWGESFETNDRGMASKWVRRGSVVYKDEYDEKVNFQSFSIDSMGNITEKKSETENGVVIEKYSFVNGCILKKIEKTKKGANVATVSFTTSPEGNFTEKTYTAGADIVSTHYWYAGSENFSRLQVTSTLSDRVPETRTADYYYDDLMRNVWVTTRSEALSLSQKTARIYAENELLVEQYQNESANGEASLMLFLRVQGQVLYITYVNANGTCSTHPCLFDINGNQIAEGFFSVQSGYSDMHTVKTLTYKYYDYVFSGQNAYGLTFSLARGQRICETQVRKFTILARPAAAGR